MQIHAQEFWFWHSTGLTGRCVEYPTSTTRTTNAQTLTLPREYAQLDGPLLVVTKGDLLLFLRQSVSCRATIPYRWAIPESWWMEASLCLWYLNLLERPYSLTGGRTRLWCGWTFSFKVLLHKKSWPTCNEYQSRTTSRIGNLHMGIHTPNHLPRFKEVRGAMLRTRIKHWIECHKWMEQLWRASFDYRPSELLISDDTRRTLKRIW